MSVGAVVGGLSIVCVAVSGASLAWSVVTSDSSAAIRVASAELALGSVLS